MPRYFFYDERLKYVNHLTFKAKLSYGNSKENKTGVINDPLGQPTVPAGSDCRWILKFCAGHTDGRTANMCENSDHYRPGLWSASWIKNKVSLK